MVKVMLNGNIRFMDDVGGLNLDKGKEAIVRNDSLKDLSFKRYLFTGNLRVTEGSLLFQYKEAFLYASPESYPFMFGVQYNEFFRKNVELDTIEWIDMNEVPELARTSLINKEVIVDKVEEPTSLVKDVPKKVAKK